MLALAGLLHDIGKPSTYEVADRIRFNGHDRIGASMAEKICHRLRLSKRQTESVAWLVANRGNADKLGKAVRLGILG